METINFVDNFLELVINLHKDLEKSLIMRPGIHDLGLLKSAVSEPFQTLFSNDLYPTIWDKAAKICYNIASDHAFEDGNKRTGIHAMLIYLDLNGITLQFTQKELEDIVVDLVNKKISLEEMRNWLLEKASEAMFSKLEKFNDPEPSKIQEGLTAQSDNHENEILQEKLQELQQRYDKLQQQYNELKSTIDLSKSDQDKGFHP